MARYPPINPSDLTYEQKTSYDYMDKTCEDSFGDAFVSKDKNGAFLGPFGPLLDIPDTVKPFMDLLKAIAAVKELPPQARETVILATGSHYKAPYETYAHERVALKKTNLSREQINLIKNGKKPNDLDAASSAAFDIAKALSEKSGPLSKELFDASVKEIGKIGTLAVIHYVALYAYTCVLLNGCDVKLPEGEEISK